MVCRSTKQGAATANTNGGIKMKASALNKMELYDREESNVIQVPQQIRLDYVEQNDDESDGIIIGVRKTYGRIKEPTVRNVIIKFKNKAFTNKPMSMMHAALVWW